jgi:hypothetical protein
VKWSTILDEAVSDYIVCAFLALIVYGAWLAQLSIEECVRLHCLSVHGAHPVLGVVGPLFTVDHARYLVLIVFRTSRSSG